MKIREATTADKAAWDAFVDSQEGHAHLYFDWKLVIETKRDVCFNILVEKEPSQIIGIFPVRKINRRFYSSLTSWIGSEGPLLKKALSKEEKYLATKMLLHYLDDKCTKRCSNSRLMQELPLGMELEDNPNQPILDAGYQVKYDKDTKLPCSFILELTPPFEKNIWMGLWSHKARKALRNVEKDGVTVIEDKELRFAETYVNMLAANYRRHGTPLIPREETLTELQVFKDKTKLFVAIKDNTPIVTLCCHYTPSTCYISQIGSNTKGTDDINKYTFKVAIEDACNSGYRFVDFGETREPGLANMKERFHGTRVPILFYEKRYSFTRSAMELFPSFMKLVFSNKRYLWANRRKILDKIFHR
jgi:hypothetical protein